MIDQPQQDRQASVLMTPEEVIRHFGPGLGQFMVDFRESIERERIDAAMCIALQWTEGGLKAEVTLAGSEPRATRIAQEVGRRINLLIVGILPMLTEHVLRTMPAIGLDG